MSKFSDLSDFILQSLNNNVNIKVIALQEIWSMPYPELVTIPNFQFVYKSRTSARGGGVAFYVKNDIHFKILDNFSYFIEKEFECLTIKILIDKKKTILSNIYRSPNSAANISQSEHLDNFISYLDTHLHNLMLTRMCFLMQILTYLTLTIIIM